MSIRVLVNEFPHRTLALATESHVLFFKHAHASTDSGLGLSQGHSSSTISLPTGNRKIESPKCLVEFSDKSTVDLKGFRSLTSAKGTLGLITLNGDVFICVITGSSEVATVRPGETVMRILAVEFYCLNRSDYDHVGGYGAGYRDGNYEPNPLPNRVFTDDYDNSGGYDSPDGVAEHPFHALKKLLNGGTFYYSYNFDLTRRLQDRFEAASTVDISSLDQGLLWNSYMINPLLSFRNRLTPKERETLDHSTLLTSVIRGYAGTLTIPTNANPVRSVKSNHPATLTVISRLSSRRAGTRFNSRGIDDSGNVANFVETETIFWLPGGLCFSYVQVRGSIPVFWESSSSLIPGQQKIQITRSPEATQLSFDRHFEGLTRTYGAVHIVNLLSAIKPGEVELTDRYRLHINKSQFRRKDFDNDKFARDEDVSHDLLKETEFDFHERSRAAGGYEGAKQIKPLIQNSADNFVYFLLQDTEQDIEMVENGRRLKRKVVQPLMVMQQHGVFRVNCLDCLDRTNLVQGIISQMALELFLEHRGEIASSSNLSIFWMRHSSLWADNGDALSKIYAGTGALKSSFTRHGKMSLGGLMADARKSATRLYVNHFEDKGRQNTVDLLLGRLVGQEEVELVDPINDWVQEQLKRRAEEFESLEKLNVWIGTYNLNGRMMNDPSELIYWLDVRRGEGYGIVVVAFQEIVELSPQQIMNTDPGRRMVWEDAVKNCINGYRNEKDVDDYILLRSGQLVGAALMVFVKGSLLSKIRNVEGAIKKTGMSGMAGNKGAVAIRMDVEGSSVCFVTAHLAAGFGNYEERNRDYGTIASGLRFQRDRRIEDHEVVIWAGDFNYRIGLDHQPTRNLVDVYRKTDGRGSTAQNAMATLYDNDQLNINMVAGTTFPYYREGKITFLPTYRFDLGRDDYDTSEKQRIPAWTDRVLWKLDHSRGTNMLQTQYDSVMKLKFSDHRPVFSTFEVDIRVVDEVKRSELLEILYERRSREVKEGIEDVYSGSDEAEDLMGYQSVAPGLPPASSDRRKWWLDGDKPVSSQVGPPRENMVLNERRPGNPWRDGGEDEWIMVDRDAKSTNNIGKLKPEPPAPRKSAKTSNQTPAPPPEKINEISTTRELETQSRTPPDPPAPRSSTPTMTMAGAWPASRNVSAASGASPRASFAVSDSPSLRPTTSRTPSMASTVSISGKKAPPPKPIKPRSLSQATQPLPGSTEDRPPPLPARTNTGTSQSTLRRSQAAVAEDDSDTSPPRISMVDNDNDGAGPASLSLSRTASLTSTTSKRPVPPPVLPRSVARAQSTIQRSQPLQDPELKPALPPRRAPTSTDLLGDLEVESSSGGGDGRGGESAWKPLLPERKRGG